VDLEVGGGGWGFKSGRVVTVVVGGVGGEVGVGLESSSSALGSFLGEREEMREASHCVM